MYSTISSILGIDMSIVSSGINNGWDDIRVHTRIWILNSLQYYKYEYISVYYFYYISVYSPDYQ